MCLESPLNPESTAWSPQPGVPGAGGHILELFNDAGNGAPHRQRRLIKGGKGKGRRRDETRDPLPTPLPIGCWKESYELLPSVLQFEAGKSHPYDLTRQEKRSGWV